MAKEPSAEAIEAANKTMFKSLTAISTNPQDHIELWAKALDAFALQARLNEAVDWRAHHTDVDWRIERVADIERQFAEKGRI